MEKSSFEKLVIDNGGTIQSSVSKKTDYLIMGEESNPAWAYGNYGRKFEKAITLIKQGVDIQILKERAVLGKLPNPL